MTVAPPRPLHEGIALAHAMAAAVAAEHGIRALVIKGPSAAHHGLRAPRVSADADVWIEPSRVDEYLRLLEARGWNERPLARASRDLTVHSATMVHPEWPCDLDVHRSFPGFLAGPDPTFDLLWERREPLVIAGVETWIPDRSGAMLIATLHALRSPHQTPRHAAELRRLVTEVVPSLDPGARADLRDLALATGAADTARPMLAHLGLELPAPSPHGVDPALDAWRARTAGGDGRSSQFLIHIRAQPWRRRPEAVWRALWPTEADFRIEHFAVPPGRWPGVRGRLARLGKGVRSIPSVVHGLVLARRGVTDDSLLREHR